MPGTTSIREQIQPLVGSCERFHDGCENYEVVGDNAMAMEFNVARLSLTRHQGLFFAGGKMMKRLLCLVIGCASERTVLCYCDYKQPIST